jgi:CBS-domain-containing membrane protein
MLIPPLAASAMLAFLAPDLPFSQPRALVGGNMLAAISGVVAFHAAGTGPLGVAIAVGLAIGLMVMARAAHAPAAATAVLATKVSAGLMFPVLPVAGACAAIVLAATAFHRVTGKSSYPMRWL